MSTLARLVDYSNPESLGSRLRKKRRTRIVDLIDRIHARQGRVRIVDLGGREVYWRIFGDDYLAARRVEVTLVNPEPQALPASPGFRVVAGDATRLGEFGDHAFDLVHSNSTIEHVGRWEKMEDFAREVRRLARAYYVQTPYFWFPVEPHAICPGFHFLPDALRARLMMRVSLGNYARASDMGTAMRQVQDAVLLDRAQMRHLFPDADHSFEWFGPLPKSLIAVRGA